MLLIVVVLVAGCKTVGGSGLDTVNPDSPGLRITNNPDEARIITSDIDNFWWAYDEATPDDGFKIFREEYFERGSLGLQEFERIKIRSVNDFVFTIWSHARYYASVRSSTLAVHSQESRIRGSFRKLKELYPDALFPSVYFVIGSLNSGGISTGQGVIIAAELFSETTSSPLDELNRWEKSVVQPVDKIDEVVAHELIHYQQRFAGTLNTLLERSIAEGVADFLSELIAGAQINEVPHEYGDRHEQRLWNEFREAMHGSDLTQWLYNGGAVAARGDPADRPADLGYYVGYKICQAYYQKAQDKKKAVKDMLTIVDFDRFLQESGYGSTFPPVARSLVNRGPSLEE